MSYSEEVYKTRKWYISHEILCFEREGGPRQVDPELTVWENLILINADGPEVAFQKAMEHGRLNEGSVQIDGAPGKCSFKGLHDLVLIYDDLEDGAELEWHDCNLKTSEVNRMIKEKENLQAFNVGPRRS